MDINEAKEWLKGNRSMCNCLSSSDPDLGQVRTAQIDAAMMEQAYWVLRASKEGLIENQEDIYTCPIHGKQEGKDCPRC